jgi:hypothetical protein
VKLSAFRLLRLPPYIAKERAFDLECLHVQTSEQRDSSKARILVQQAEDAATELSVTVHTSVRLAHHQVVAVGEIIDRRPIEMVVLALDSATDLLELEMIVEQTTCPILASSASYRGNASVITLTILGLDPAQVDSSREIGQIIRQSSSAKDATLKEKAEESEKASKIVEQFSQNDQGDNELVILALSRQNFIALFKTAEVRELLKSPSTNFIFGKLMSKLFDWTAIVFSLLTLQSVSAVQASDFHKDIIYQVFTDRFFNGRQDNDNPPQSPGLFDGGRKNWKAYWGGDLAGVREKLPYIKSLGCTAIWISPCIDNINKPDNDSAGNMVAPYHGYHARDFMRVDEHFGDSDNSWRDFDALTKAAHELNMRVFVDMPFNHTSPYNHAEYGALV